ncbi:hypothetical protein SADUNF_Sadunf19G0115700 [Salix dunnii]|uniref:Reverse transcriptase Ty1/copia-type domain-containing protein n=1 Tax=Salix dunnii TaxID=1413687 RepID=A0A835J1Q3_9ROSI|nr:hypothetical protein SADUNF_Sadunf19G0115700 [Salix dunnii]
MLEAKPAGLPLDQNHRLSLAKGSLLSDPEHYRRLVGQLIYLSVTRPKLSYCVHMLAQFMQSMSGTLGCSSLCCPISKRSTSNRQFETAELHMARHI